MSDPFTTYADDNADELVPGRGDIDGTWSPDWIVLSGCSARALQLYQMLRLRLNRRRRSQKVWPGLATLATMMNLTTSESVSPYVKELKELGAIDVDRSKTTPRHNIYRINITPPPGYAGPMAIEDWDADPTNRVEVKRILSVEKAKRDKTRAGGTVKPQVSKEPGKTPVQRRPGKTGRLEPGKIRVQEPGKNRDLDPGFSGVEPLGLNLSGSVEVRTTSSLSPSGPERSDEAEARAESEPREEEIDSSSEQANQEINLRDFHPTLTEWEEALHAELASLRPDWTPRQIRQAIGLPMVRERTARSPELVRRAFLAAARDRSNVKTGYKGTWSPLRLKADGCPLWRTAEAELAAEADRPKPDRQAVTPEPLQSIAAPSRLQEPEDETETFESRAEAKAVLRERLSKGRDRMHTTDKPRTTHQDRMAELDNLLAEMSAGRAS